MDELEHTVIKVKNHQTVVSYDVYITLPIETIRKHFIFNYCRTGHSLQGTTINDDITIFDFNLPFITRKWLWVSITRSRSLKQIKFYNGKDNDLSDKLLDKY